MEGLGGAKLPNDMPMRWNYSVPARSMWDTCGTALGYRPGCREHGHRERSTDALVPRLFGADLQRAPSMDDSAQAGVQFGLGRRGLRGGGREAWLELRKVVLPERIENAAGRLEIQINQPLRRRLEVGLCSTPL